MFTLNFKKINYYYPIILKIGFYLSLYLFYYFIFGKFFKLFDGDLSPLQNRLSLYLVFASYFILELIFDFNSHINKILSDKYLLFTLIFYSFCLLIYFILIILKINSRLSGDIYFWILPIITFITFKILYTVNLNRYYILLLVIAFLSLFIQFNKDKVLNSESFISEENLELINKYIGNNNNESTQIFEIKTDSGTIYRFRTENDICKNFLTKTVELNYCYTLSLVDKFIYIKNNSTISQSDYMNLANKYFDAKAINAANLANYFGRVLGFVFHHYQIISNATYNFFENQYGIGPIAIINLVNYLTNFSLFDSIFVSYQIIELSFLIFVLILIRKFELKYKILILLSLILSNSSIGYTSQYLAPLLFSIRYLPHLILITFIVQKLILTNEKTLIFSNFEKLFISLFLVLILIYNIEYGIFSALAFLISGLILRNKNLIILSLFYFLSYLIYFIIKFDYGVNTYIDHLTHSGLPRKPDFLVYIFTLANLATLFYILGFCRSLLNNLYFLTIFISLQIFWIKIIWINSGNHVGYLFFILMCLVVIIYNNKTSFKNVKFFVFFIAFLYLGSLIYSFSRISDNIGERFNFLSYTKSDMSKFLDIDTSLYNKLSIFKNNYKADDFVISPIDAALSLYVEKKLTVTPDIATSVFHSKNNNIIFNSIPNNRRIVIDKSIIQYEYILSKYFFYEDKNHFHQFKLLKNLSDFVINNPHFIECNSNKYFIYYCPIKK